MGKTNLQVKQFPTMLEAEELHIEYGDLHGEAILS